MRYAIVIEKAESNYAAYVPDLPGCVTTGATVAEVEANIRKVIADCDCDGVSIARPLLANPNLPHIFAAGEDLPAKPCTYCNKCLLHVVEDPYGCYEVSRYDGDYDKMMAEIMSVFEPSI